MSTREFVVLLDADGQAAGTADKATIHGATTPLHLAFSAYLFDDVGRFLLSRRAADKLTFPLVWTNSVCGHPGPGEPIETAVRRRAALELGLPTIRGLRLVLPDFGYRASMAGIEEHELCPVFVGWLPAGAVPAPDPTEVAEVGWVDWGEHVCRVAADPDSWSPWTVAQLAALSALGPDPREWPEGDPALLPPAARTP